MLYLVSTPIGNLKDITLRALEVLRSVDLVLAEDKQRALKLLNFYEIKKPLLKYHDHLSPRQIKKIINLLRQKKDIALICNAGTPCISDPGAKLVASVYKFLPWSIVVAVPGPCALIAALSLSGLYGDKFLFLGFPPKKKKRTKFFKRIIEEIYPVVFYESPHQILRTLYDLKQEMIKTGKWKKVIVFRELTKKFEQRIEGHINEVIEKLSHKKIQGEFTIIVYG